MIFTALGALVVAGAFLIAGIAKSSVTLLVVSLVCTAVAGFLLLATTDIARRRAWPQQGVLPVVNPAIAGTGTPVVMYLPAPGADGNGPAGSAPIAGYEAMSAEQVVKLVGSGALAREQLVAVRAYELAGAARKTVLDRIDRAMRSAS